MGAAARGGGLEREADEARDAARVWKASASGWRKGSTMGCKSTRRRWRGRVRERIEGAGRVHSYVESAESRITIDFLATVANAMAERNGGQKIRGWI